MKMFFWEQQEGVQKDLLDIVLRLRTPLIDYLFSITQISYQDFIWQNRDNNMSRHLDTERLCDITYVHILLLEGRKRTLRISIVHYHTTSLPLSCSRARSTQPHATNRPPSERAPDWSRSRGTRKIELFIKFRNLSQPTTYMRIYLNRWETSLYRWHARMGA